LGKIVLAQIRTEGVAAAEETIRRYRQYAEEGRAKDLEIMRSHAVQSRGDYYQATWLRAWCGDYAGAVPGILANDEFDGPPTDLQAVRRANLVMLLDIVPRKDWEAARPLFVAARKEVDDAGLPGRPTTGESYWSRADDYGAIAVGLARMGRFAEAIETIGRATLITEPPNPLGTRRSSIARAYIMIADLQREAGDRAGAITSIHAAVPFCGERGGRVRPWPTHLAVDVLVRARALIEARKLTDVIFPPENSPDTRAR
jgi:hypothetical protein